jgi:hypothetical protein
MTEELARHTIEGGALVESLNRLYTGKNADRQSIESQIKRLDDFSIKGKTANNGESRFVGAI